MNADNIYLPIRFYEPEAEAREEYIEYCGAQMECCYASGNREAAENWMQAQNEAIRGRSAARVAEMERDYFGSMGAADRAALEARHANQA